MDLINILYEPYVIMIFISLIITGITYFTVCKSKTEEEEEAPNNSRTLFFTFVISYLVLIGIHFLIGYMDKNNYFQKGGNIDVKEHLTIVADDVDVGFIE
jgi:heme/copper-type cytochrome/quinol oxidase subunit 2